MNLKQFPGILALAGLALGASTALADSHEAEPGLTSVWMFTPKTGMGEKFEESVKKHIAYRQEQGDSRDWQMYSVEMGDKMGIYQVRFCCFDWADQDAYQAESAEKEFGDHFNKTVANTVDRMHHYFEENDNDNSQWNSEGTDWQLYGVTSWVLKEGAGAAPEQMRIELSQLAKKNGWDQNWLWLKRVGGKPMLMIASPFENYADMAPPEQDFFEFLVANTELSPEEVGSMFDTFGSGMQSSEYTVWRHRPDLSLPEAD